MVEPTGKTDQAAAPPPLTAEATAELRDDFLVAQRKDHSIKPRFLTDGLFDLEKLFGLYEAAGIDYPASPMIPHEVAATDRQTLDPRPIGYLARA